ncbi:MAG: DNA-binding LacI/PurR family transcriptional regulator [Glaciecola sp.]|jgi:DNA-binding LacI/PurR family transcriptional regulator
MTQHLLALGHRTFAFIGEASDSAPELKARYNGCVSALERVALRQAMLMQVDAISSETDGYLATIKTLENLPNNQRPDALICASDLMATGAIRAVREKGLKVPEDIAIVGYDNIQVSSYSSPTLTTVGQNTVLAGKLLVSNLLKLINNEMVDDIVMQPELLVRRSCGAPSEP